MSRASFFFCWAWILQQALLRSSLVVHLLQLLWRDWWSSGKQRFLSFTLMLGISAASVCAALILMWLMILFMKMETVLVLRETGLAVVSTRLLKGKSNPNMPSIDCEGCHEFGVSGVWCRHTQIHHSQWLEELELWEWSPWLGVRFCVWKLQDSMGKIVSCTRGFQSSCTQELWEETKTFIYTVFVWKTEWFVDLLWKNLIVVPILQCMHTMWKVWFCTWKGMVFDVMSL